MRVMFSFYYHQTILERINYSYITLIPKKESNYTVKDYHPICLLHGVVKIISKVLLMRLAGKLDSLIAPTQFAFIRGRTFAESFTTTKEVISQAHKANH